MLFTNRPCMSVQDCGLQSIYSLFSNLFYGHSLIPSILFTLTMFLFALLSFFFSFSFQRTKLGQLAWTPKTCSTETNPLPEFPVTFVQISQHLNNNKSSIIVVETDKDFNSSGGVRERGVVPAWRDIGSTETGAVKESGHGRGTPQWGTGWSDRATFSFFDFFLLFLSVIPFSSPRSNNIK